MVKNRVPYYKKGEIKSIYKTFSTKEKKVFEEFLRYCSITAGERKLDDIKRSLTQFRDIINKDFEKCTLKDLRDFLSLLKKSGKKPNTSNEIKTTIKRFLRWKFEDWSKRFNNLDDIKLESKRNEERINEQTLIKKGDIEKIVKKEPRIKYKAFFMTMYEGGLRPKEVRFLKWNDIKLDYDGDISQIKIFATKTQKARTVYVKSATYFLKQLKEEQTNSLLVFPSPTNKGEPLTKGAVSLWLKKLSKKALGREVHPYLLRHSRATELYLNANISDSIAQKFLGHSKNMKDVYTHMSSKDVKEALQKTVYNLEYVEPEKKADYEKRIKHLEAELSEIKTFLHHYAEGLKTGKMPQLVRKKKSSDGSFTWEKITS